MNSIQQHAVLRAIVALRTAAMTETIDGQARVELRRSERELASLLGSTVAKGPAAKVLGITTQGLDHWLARGALTTVRREGAARSAVEVAGLIELAVEVRRQSMADGAGRRQVAKAIRSLGLHLPGRPVVIGPELAALPRPNMAMAELLAHVQATTPSQRLEQAARLSRDLTSIRIAS